LFGEKISHPITCSLIINHAISAVLLDVILAEDSKKSVDRSLWSKQ